jgi:hypothetical protein
MKIDNIDNIRVQQIQGHDISETKSAAGSCDAAAKGWYVFMYMYIHMICMYVYKYSDIGL